jgi:hypothetical protein
MFCLPAFLHPPLWFGPKPHGLLSYRFHFSLLLMKFRVKIFCFFNVNRAIPREKNYLHPVQALHHFKMC